MARWVRNTMFFASSRRCAFALKTPPFESQQSMSRRPRDRTSTEIVTASLRLCVGFSSDGCLDAYLSPNFLPRTLARIFFGSMAMAGTILAPPPILGSPAGHPVDLDRCERLEPATDSRIRRRAQRSPLSLARTTLRLMSRTVSSGFSFLASCHCSRASASSPRR